MKKVLVVEDESAYIKLLRDQLVENGYDVFEARNGVDGLATARREEFDLILLDIRMPLMDGLTMLSELRKQEPRKTTKVIILTNLEPDDQTLQRVIEDLPTYYLMKSDTKLDDLIEKIREIVTKLPVHTKS